MVAVLKIGGGEGGGVQQGDEQSAEGRDRGPLKGRVNRKGEGGGISGGGRLRVAGGLHWFNATAEAAVKRGLPFFPRPVRRRNPASACQGQVTFFNIYTGPADSHNAYAQLIYFMYAHRQTHTCMHTASRQPLRRRQRWGPGESIMTLFSIPLEPLFHLAN